MAPNGGWAVLARRGTGFHLRSVAKASSVLGLLLFARFAIADAAEGTVPSATATLVPAAAEPPGSTVSAPPVSQKISYEGGQLQINAVNLTLADVLTKVAALTGVKIEVPADTGNERMPVVELGPGPARQVLASLLSDSNFDYLIQASEKDPEKIQNVLLMPREKKGSGNNATEAAARPSRSPYARAAAPAPRPEEPAVPDNPAPAPLENAAAAASSLNPQLASTQPDQVTPPASVPLDSVALDPSLQLPLGQPEQTNVPKTFPVPLPPVLDQQNISQQLQQMYQQRQQMLQQERQAGGQTTPASPQIR